MPGSDEHRNGAELFNHIVRIAVLVLSAGVMVAGLIVVAGVVHLRSVPDQFRWVLGIVVFLYGLYRFVIAFNRRPARR